MIKNVVNKLIKMYIHLYNPDVLLYTKLAKLISNMP